MNYFIADKERRSKLAVFSDDVRFDSTEGLGYSSGSSFSGEPTKKYQWPALISWDRTTAAGSKSTVSRFRVSKPTGKESFYEASAKKRSQQDAAIRARLKEFHTLQQARYEQKERLREVIKTETVRLMDTRQERVAAKANAAVQARAEELARLSQRQAEKAANGAAKRYHHAFC